MSISEKPVIVLAEDEVQYHSLFQNLARAADVKIDVRESLSEAVAAINEHAQNGDLCGLVTDLKFGTKQDGWHIICRALRVSSSIPIALWTAWSDDPVHQVFGSAAPFRLFPKTSVGNSDLAR